MADEPKGEFAAPPAGMFPILDGLSSGGGTPAGAPPAAPGPGPAATLPDSEFYVEGGKKYTPKEIRDWREQGMRRDKFNQFVLQSQEREAALEKRARLIDSLEQKHPNEFQRVMAILTGMPVPANGNGDEGVGAGTGEDEVPPYVQELHGRLETIENERREQRIESLRGDYDREFAEMREKWPGLPWDRLEPSIEAAMLANPDLRSPKNALKIEFEAVYEGALTQAAIDRHLADQKGAGKAAGVVESGGAGKASGASIDPSKMSEEDKRAFMASRLDPHFGKGD